MSRRLPAVILCPYCGELDRSKVRESRGSARGDAILRTRTCLSCHRRYPTAERLMPQEKLRSQR